MNTENHFAAIAALDLDPIKVKLMHKESGEGWSRAYADSIEFEYRRFLYLVKEFPNEQAAPLFDVDVFWHYHILDTMKYAADCETVFGYFLHHFPYVGLRGGDDVEAHHRVGERMRELYEQTYGDEYPRLGVSASSAANDNVAFSVPATRIGFSVPAGKVAFSVPAQQSAFSVPNQNAATSLETARTAWSLPSATATFYSVRPTLSPLV